MRNKQEIEKRTIKVIAEQLCFPREKDKVKPESTFRGDLGADSLDEVEILMALEDEFGIEISDADAEKISTVKEAVEYLTERVAPNDLGIRRAAFGASVLTDGLAVRPMKARRLTRS